MEYVQMTLDDWMEMKNKIRHEIQSVKLSFIRIGYALRKIDDGKLYEKDGYKSIAEFASKEFDIGTSTTSRLMAINREFSVDGYSEYLRPDKEGMGLSQLTEMLALPEADRALITPKTPRETIRELKRFNAEPEQAETNEDIRDLIRDFYQKNPENLNDFFKALNEGAPEEEEITEIINPSGNRMYKKYPFFMIMGEDRVSIKRKEMNFAQVMTWGEFADITINIFADVADGENTWENYFGGKEDEPKGAEEKETESMDAGSGDVGSATECDHPESAAGYTEPEEEETQGDPEGVQIAAGETGDQLPPVAAQKQNVEEAAKTAAEQEENPEKTQEGGEKRYIEIAPGEYADNSVVPKALMDIIENNIVDGEVIEEKTVAPAQSDTPILDVEVTPAERDGLRTAYETLAAIAWRYPGDVRTTTKGSAIYDTAMSIREILSWYGIEVEELFENYGVTD